VRDVPATPAGLAVPAVQGVAAAHDTAAVAAIETVIRQFLTANRPERREEREGREGREGRKAREGHQGPEDRGRPRQLAANRNLWREVSSLTLLQLVAFVEQKFAIKVRPIDFAPQNFATVSAIARFVAARRRPVADP